MRTKTIKRHGGSDGFNEKKLIKRLIEFAKNDPDVKHALKIPDIGSLLSNAITNNSNYLTNIKSLPVLLAVYSVLVKKPTMPVNTEENQPDNPDNIPDSLLLNFVVHKIREIERKHPHPNLLNTVLYYFDLVDFPTAMAMLSIYLDKLVNQLIPSGNAESEVIDHIEKNLAHYSSIEDWVASQESNSDKDNTRFKYKTVKNNLSQYELANSQMNALFSSPWKSFDTTIKDKKPKDEKPKDEKTKDEKTKDEKTKDEKPKDETPII